MKKNDVYAHACKILHLLAEEGRLSIRKIGELTNTRECTTFMALGWLSKEDKIKLFENGGMMYVERNAILAPETYY